MSFKLVEILDRVSDKEMGCDGVDAIFKYMEYATFEQKIKHVVTMFKVRKFKIKPDETYVHLKVVDEDSGEIFEMNCKKGVHKYCIEKGIYPKVLIDILQ